MNHDPYEGVSPVPPLVPTFHDVRICWTRFAMTDLAPVSSAIPFAAFLGRSLGTFLSVGTGAAAVIRWQDRHLGCKSRPVVCFRLSVDGGGIVVC